MSKIKYKKFIEDNFSIVNKESQTVPFELNKIQDRYINQDCSSKDIILKARQQGFSSVILATFTTDFILLPNSRNVVVADIDDNATELLDRVKYFISSYEYNNKVKIPLKYNSKTELFNQENNSRYTIGTAKNVEFGRSKTITNLHMSEAAFYPHLDKILAGAANAVVPTGRTIIETTANGFNQFRALWTDSTRGETSYKPLFYKASDFYDVEFLETKKKELRNMFKQEYPETAEEAFITSGDCYFNSEVLAELLKEAGTYAQI